METSIFWANEGVGDGPLIGYSQDELTKWQRMLHNQNPATEGVALNYLGGLLVITPGAVTLRVASGGGVAYGFPYRSTGDIDHTLVNPTLGATGWRVVLRTDWEARTVRSALLQAADGVATIPTLTQTADTVWEIALSQGTVDNFGAVTIDADERTSLGSGGRWVVNTANIADDAVTSDKTANRTRKLFIPATGMYHTAVLEANGVSRVYTAGWKTGDAVLRAIVGNAIIPNDFVSGAIVQAVVTYVQANGNYYMQASADYGSVGENWNTHTAAFAGVAVPLVADHPTLIASMTLVDAVVGDYIHLWLEHDSTQGTDTGTGCFVSGWLLTYTASG